MNMQVDTRALMTLAADQTPCHDAMSPTEGGNLARIVLHDQVYSLRITRAGKLILTK